MVARSRHLPPDHEERRERLPLFDSAPRDAGLAERWQAFAEANPAAVQRLASLALAQRTAGVRRGSIAQLFEVVRYERSIDVTPERGYRLNNDLRAPAARYLMRAFPELRGWFETRTSAVDSRARDNDDDA